jgi:hypothetical protein
VQRTPEQVIRFRHGIRLPYSHAAAVPKSYQRRPRPARLRRMSLATVTRNFLLNGAPHPRCRMAFLSYTQDDPAR